MTFDLVPSRPALIDTSDNETKAAVAKGFGLRDPNNAVVAPPRRFTGHAGRTRRSDGCRQGARGTGTS
jgi:hypothetical protein